MRGTKSKCVELDRTAHNTAMKAVKVRGEWKRTLVLLREMQGDGIRPDTATYETVNRAMVVWAVRESYRYRQGDGEKEPSIRR